MNPKTGVPEDYAELFTAYFPLMRRIVSKAGIASEDTEDVAMDLLLKFIEKEGIDYYDPTRPTKFSSMLRGFTSTYVMQSRDKQMIRHRRFPWRLEAPISGDSKDTWADIQIDPLDFRLEITEDSVAVIAALKKARAILCARSEGSRDYAIFFDACIREGLLSDSLNRKLLQAELGLSAGTFRSMLWELRAVLRPLLDGVSHSNVA